MFPPRSLPTRSCLDEPGASRFNSRRSRAGPIFRSARRAATRPSTFFFSIGQVAQSVEQRTENPRVGSSILPLATNQNKISDFQDHSLSFDANRYP